MLTLAQVVHVFVSLIFTSLWFVTVILDIINLRHSQVEPLKKELFPAALSSQVF